MTLPHLLKRAAFKNPQREAIVSDTGRWTYDQWEKKANQRARALGKRGIKKGDHVATIFLNGNEVLETFMALMKLGAVIVPLNARLSGRELHYIVDHSEAVALILSHEFESIIREIKGDLPRIKQSFMSGGDVPEDMVDFEKICQEASEEEHDIEIEEDDIACILYTAGTTGLRKGVLLSHSNCIWALVNIATNIDLQPEYRVLLVFPLYHAAAFIILISNVFMGCTNVTMRSFDPKRVMELIKRKRSTG